MRKGTKELAQRSPFPALPYISFLAPQQKNAKKAILSCVWCRGELGLAIMVLRRVHSAWTTYEHVVRGGHVEVLTAWIAPPGNDSPTTALHSDLGMATQWKTKHMTKQGAGFSWKGPRNGRQHDLPRKYLRIVSYISFR